ncbi:MAG: HAMP domain-containing sensor histidine kinase [Spirochaetales bacterium]
MLQRAKERLELIVWGYGSPSSNIDVYSYVDFDTEVLVVEKDRMLVFQYGTAWLDLTSSEVTVLRKQSGSFHFSLYVDKERTRLQYFSFANVTILITVSVFIAFFFLFGWFLLRKMVDPVSHLARTMVSITSRNLWVRLPLPKRKDEIGQLIRSFNTMMDEIGKAYELRLQHVEDVIHDIVTPVQILEGYRQLIERHGRTEELVSEFLEVSQVELHKLRKMALSLKDSMREEKKRSLEWVDASKITERILQAYQELHPHILFHKEVASGVLLPIDPLDLERMEHILLDNAVKYGGKEVWIRLVPGELSIQDLGPGIPQQEQERVFERYYRSETAKRTRKGSGIGLSILKRFAEEYGFSVEIESDSGKGCLFRLRFR